MYKVPVKIEGIERRKKTTGPLHVLAGFFLLGNATHYFFQARPAAMAPFILLLLIALVSLLYGFFRNRLDAAAAYNHWLRLLQFSGFSYLVISAVTVFSDLNLFFLVMWMLLLLAFMFTERKIFQDTELIIKKEGVFLPGYFSSRLLPWSTIRNFVLRPDFITIQRNNNKYLQLELLNNIPFEEIETINSYCNQQVSAAAIPPQS